MSTTTRDFSRERGGLRSVGSPEYESTPTSTHLARRRVARHGEVSAEARGV